MSACEEENMVELVEEHTILCMMGQILVMQERTKLIECMKTSAKNKLIYVVYSMHCDIIITVQNQPSAHLLHFNFTKYLLHVSIPKGTSSGS